MKKLIFILGSTDLWVHNAKILDKKILLFRTFFSNKNFKLICSQIKKYKPKIFLINNEKVYDKVKKKI